jgi:serine protease AprX
MCRRVLLVHKVRRKATWGSRIARSFTFLLLIALSVPGFAEARAKGKGKAGTLDTHVEERSGQGGETAVIIEFTDDSDAVSVIKGFGKAGRKLGIIKGYSARIPNGLLKQLAKHPLVKKVSLDRTVEGFTGRTSVTVGARAVQHIMGYTGAGIGVAVIDSGVTPWHDDLTVDSRSGQRVAHFKDFVNGRTKAYDDWGHGTHVAGIVAGNGYDSSGTRESIAPDATLVALKALKSDGTGTISTVIAAIDYAVSVRSLYNIRVINLSLGAGVYESYNTDPLTVACKRAVEAGIVVVAAAGNMGKAADGTPQYGAIRSPGNAPWVLTVGASSHEGTVDRRDDKMAPYSSRGPTMVDYAAKPDLVAPGSGTVSLSDRHSRLYTEKAGQLVKGTVTPLSVNYLGVPVLNTSFLPYLTLSGTSMATPVVSGSVALMLQANPNLTPNMVKAILQYTAQVYPGYDYLTQGAGFLNTRGAVVLSEYFRTGEPGDRYPKMKGWSQHIFWGNYRVTGGVLTPGGTAWGLNVVWGEQTVRGQNVVWGENCDGLATCDNDNIVWGNNVVWGEDLDDNIVWGNTDGDNIVWGNSDGDNIVWGNGDMDNIVWGNSALDNIVWGDDCGGANCENVAWGYMDLDNIVWGNAEGIDNIVWGNMDLDNIVWGNMDLDNIVWGNGAEDEPVVFGDDAAEVDNFDATIWDILFESTVSEDVIEPVLTPEPATVLEPVLVLEPVVIEPVLILEPPTMSELLTTVGGVQ